MSAATLEIVGSGDADDYFEQGILDAERAANRRPEPETPVEIPVNARRFVDVSQGLRVIDLASTSWRKRSMALPTGTMAVGLMVSPKLNAPQPIWINNPN
jgi:hypothetical protein